MKTEIEKIHHELRKRGWKQEPPWLKEEAWTRFNDRVRVRANGSVIEIEGACYMQTRSLAPFFALARLMASEL